MTAGSSVLATPKEVSRLIQVGQGDLSLDLLLLSLAILLPPGPLPPPLPLLLTHTVHHEELEHSAPVVLHGGVEPTSRIAVASLPSALGLTKEGLRGQQEPLEGPGDVELVLGVEDGPEDGGHYPGPLDLHRPRHRAHGQERVEDTLPCMLPVGRCPPS